MAQTKRRPQSGRKSTGSRKKTNTNQRTGISEEAFDEIVSIVLIFLAVFVFLCNFGLFGTVGEWVSSVMFGLFGLTAYVIPLVVGVICFIKINRNIEDLPPFRVIGVIVALLMLGVLCEIAFHAPSGEGFNLSGIWGYASENHKGGGFFGGSVAYAFVKLLDKVGAILLSVVILIICFVLITGRSFLGGIAAATGKTYQAASGYRERVRNRYEENEEVREMRREERDRKREERRLESERRREENDRLREEREMEKLLQDQIAEDEKIIRRVSGVTTYNFVSEEETAVLKNSRDDIHEINLVNEEAYEDPVSEGIVIHSANASSDEIKELNFEAEYEPEEEEDILIPGSRDTVRVKEESIFASGDHIPSNGGRTFTAPKETSAKDTVPSKKPAKKVPYKLPSTKLLNEPPAPKGNDENELMQTARKLEEVLQSFNVKVKVTDISRGPAVTRYEMIPETGVKVSRILGLSDDIKLNLAAADIRIEAPIPGKSAIGIEVPNRESSPVVLRELLESKEYRSASSKISFAVGKDLTGNVIVSDIAKMPHMLIAGGTGSGKSVCINTLIMSILYKASPDEVKLIMVDPKVVELSVYNGIPHLLIPVVTDPKKASAALQWAVSEMEDRYRKFSDYGVRNLKGYNEAIKNEKDENGVPVPQMFQLVVIVDELADLMMVAGKEVEESICRLAQLARAAGIHLIIATQRPSVDVITGLIKANMPSRVAFAVSSGVDSRTILDMNGAEKLLGKGDMLFHPQGYPKPARVQGAFVDDPEVSRVVEFLKGNSDSSVYNDEILNKINTSASASAGNSGSSSVGGDEGEDEFFTEAARLIVSTNKASIGMLQRKFKIGFNRAARIMDALAEAGVVGPEEGTKARTILMSPEQLENFLNGE